MRLPGCGTLANMTYDDPVVRPANEADLDALAGIEAEGDRRFDELFGGVDWDPPRSGRQRAAEPGFLLVAGDPVVGFAHVIEEDGRAHLEQLGVRTDHAGRGIGTALVEACVAEAARRGHDRLSLTTYPDVPWNGPFYRRLGFVEVDRVGLGSDDPLVRHLRDEARLEQHGRRAGMVRRIKE